MKQNKLLLTSQELAERWGWSLNTVRQWTSQKRIPHIKLGRLVKFDIFDLEANWLKDKIVKPSRVWDGNIH